ncbi:hypothetical protein EFK50_08480 [Nocardioides marmoriginsengisoli]|uniref:Uncharacterized protein n=1 Tax=Nocardioides marmoriginsengisoli TaxID=661483 RepID=A0A3N0CL62_9ACTN|nr:hypothetical protein [Nocardioides marmoriginsengisoli]RNL63756.1 hypothetical protein EFK50_08480 [Nocardioides marmoriginsengisoli]
MSATCEKAAEEVTRNLGFDCHDVSPVVSFHNPFDLASWTMPILELAVIGGAIFALVHAVRRFRAGDPINLALWFASLVYLFVTEPPLYFPEWFGLDKQYGFIFAHNVFSVQFMWDRLPLYIIAFYPAISALAYEVVRVTGIFKHRGALAGAVAVAFVCQVFYEIFDMVGPQLKWWAWYDGNLKVNHPALASVPMNSMLLFASASMGAMAFLVVRIAGSRGADGGPRRGWSLTWRILVAGVLTPLTMVVFGVPSAIFGGDTPNLTAQAWVLGIELGLVWVAGLWILLGHRRRQGDDPEPMTPFARIYPLVYLAAMVIAWIGALPAFLDAENGITSDGTPIGSGWYTLACFLGAAVILVVLHAGRRRAPTAETVSVR